MVTDVFENVRNKCIEIYKLASAHFLSAPGLASEACLKKTKLKSLIDTDMPSLKIEKGIRGGIFHAMHGYANANNTYMKNHDHHKFCI